MSESIEQVKRVEEKRPCRAYSTESQLLIRPLCGSCGYGKEKQVLALLETMKVFQKVKSPVNGIIIEILVENETPLKEGDSMFIIELE